MPPFEPHSLLALVPNVALSLVPTRVKEAIAATAINAGNQLILDCRYAGFVSDQSRKKSTYRNSIALDKTHRRLQ